MKKIILTYGVVAGVIAIAGTVVGLYLSGNGEVAGFSVWLGFLIMIVALSAIFVGIKRYRDQELGGVVKFSTALLLGLGISVVAGLAYVGGWEIYLALTDYAFIDEYAQSVIADAMADGVSGEELADIERDMGEMSAAYSNVFYRLPMTFIEIFPVGLLISLISAALLRNPKLLPATV